MVLLFSHPLFFLGVLIFFLVLLVWCCFPTTSLEWWYCPPLSFFWVVLPFSSFLFLLPPSSGSCAAGRCCSPFLSLWYGGASAPPNRREQDHRKVDGKSRGTTAAPPKRRRPPFPFFGRCCFCPSFIGRWCCISPSSFGPVLFFLSSLSVSFRCAATGTRNILKHVTFYGVRCCWFIPVRHTARTDIGINRHYVLDVIVLSDTQWIVACVFVHRGAAELQVSRLTSQYDHSKVAFSSGTQQ